MSTPCPSLRSPRRGWSVAWTGAAAALACAGALASCDLVGSADDPEALESAAFPLIRTPRSLDLSPGNPVIQVDLNQKGTRLFKSIVRYNDRSTADVTALATFTLDNPALGAVTGASFESAIRTSSQVGFGSLTATYREAGVEVSTSTPLTVIWLRTTGVAKDLVITLPYGGATESTTLSARTNFQSLDTFFAIDTTGSMGSEIAAIRDSLDMMILPAVRVLAVRDAWFGVGAIDDFGVSPYGSPGCSGGPDDQPFILLGPMSGDAMATKMGVASLLRGTSPRGCGGDTAEGQMEALYQIATGAGNIVSGVVNIPAHKDKGRGGVEFRVGALPIVSLVTDASFHSKSEPGRTCFGSTLDYSGAAATAAHTRTETTTALRNLCARVVGVSIALSGSEEGCLGTKDLQGFASATGALVPPGAWDAAGTRPMGCTAGQCCTGVKGAGEAPNADGLCPLVMLAESTGTGVGSQVVAGITNLVRYAAFDAGLAKYGGSAGEDGTALPMGKSTSDFVTAIKAVDATLPTLPTGWPTAVVGTDRFTKVTPGSTLRFTIEAKNDFAPAATRTQVFRARVVAQASGCADLDDRDVFFVVPPA